MSALAVREYLPRQNPGDGVHGRLGVIVGGPMASTADRPNLLAYGDNLDVLKRHVASESVDLVYLDPPFNSNADYNVLFAEHGAKAAAQIKAFGDTWAWDTVAAATYQEMVEAGGPVASTLRAFRTMLGTSDMLAYLSMMAPRLVELHRVLRDNGSLFLHCDPTASHYLKLLLDSIFGPRNLCNEIIWSYRRWTAPSKRLQRLHDVIFWYAKDYGRHTYNTLWVPPANVEKGRRESYAPNAAGKLVRLQSLHGARYEIERDPRGVHAGDVWDISFLHPSAKERLGYPTQKPEALLERIISAASNPGDVVLDPFCGCGTAVAVAQNLGRRWVGIDITHIATGLIKHRLVGRFGIDIAQTVAIIGEPTTEEDAAALAAEDPFQFQAWALGLVGARQATSAKKGGDKGIDGRLYFHDMVGGPSRQIVLSVKAGHLVPAYVRDLAGVIAREAADIGVLLSFEEPSPGIRAEAASAGFFEAHDGAHPRIQLRTVAELLDGHGIDYPSPIEAPQTLWPPNSIPVVPRAPRRASRRPQTTTPVPVDASTSEAVRERYQRSLSQGEPRSLRTSKHGRPVPLPSLESGDMD